MPIALAVHGGAWNIPDEAVESCRGGVSRALERGWRRLHDGGTALDVVEQVVRALEDDPSFDAGRGSRFNSEGQVEMDASIMVGSDLSAGAVAAIQNVSHPISVARMLMERTANVMLVGAGARSFAERSGAELCSTEDLLVGRERDRYRRVLSGERDLVELEFDDRTDDPRPMGTVGAVALDASGHVAAATSTGGIQHKTPGRVGDTPIIGAGTYADDRAGAASATGQGESILRVVLSKTAIDLISAGRSPEQAGTEAIATLERVRGRAGLILVDLSGRVATVFNTPRMARGRATERDGIQVSVNPTSESR